MFHPHWREQALALADERFDLIVIGGGITGSGILMDAAQRGLRVLLIERDDIASGTSSRSSKMIHGGLRYLKQMQFRITRLASRERDRMVVLNPHLVRPIRFLYPANRSDKVPGWTVDLGLWMYDRMTNRPQKHAHLDVDRVLEMAPDLDVADLERAMSYTDAVTDDALMTLAAAATGFAYGGLVLTRAEVVEATRAADGRIDGVVVRDHETGGSHTFRARLVINAAGVWVDRLREAFGIEGKKVRPSRGTHIVLPTHRLPITAALTIPSPDDGRPIFLIPHPEGILVGTTDHYHDGPLDDPRPTQAEVAYLFRALAVQFPGRKLVTQDVVGAFAGLRPILDIHADSPSAASREEEIWEEQGMLNISGGKLTTWRVMAEEVVDEALDYLPDERASRAAPCYTEGTPFVGVAPLDLADRLAREHSIEPAVASGLARRLRGYAWAAPEMARDAGELLPLIDGIDLSAAEVRVHLSRGAVLRLEDLLLRRARIGLWHPDLARMLPPHLERLFAEELGWSHARWTKEQEGFEAALAAWSVRGIAPGE